MKNGLLLVITRLKVSDAYLTRSPYKEQRILVRAELGDVA